MAISGDPLKKTESKGSIFKTPSLNFLTSPENIQEQEKTENNFTALKTEDNLITQNNLKTCKFPSIDFKFGNKEDPARFNGKVSVGLGDYTQVNQDYLPFIGTKIEKVYLHKADLKDIKDNLLFNDFEIGQLKQKINTPPYAAWWQNILSVANSSLNGNLSSQTMVEADRSQRAEACALAYKITGNRKYLDAAKEGLLNIAPPNKYGITEGSINQGGIRNGPGWQRWLETGPALESYAYAYDLIKNSLEANEKNTVVNKLGTEAHEVYKYLDVIGSNNWSVIAASGLGSVALALADTNGAKGDSPQDWLDKAIDGIGKGFSPISRDGVNSEGAHYALYSNKSFLPFANSYYKATGVNVLDNPKIKAMNEWLVKMVKPDGQMPAIGDSWADDPIESRLLINRNVSNASSFKWLNSQMNQSLQDSVGDTKLAIESLAFYDKNIPVAKQPSEHTTNFFPVGGETIFRNNWSKDAVYGLMIGHQKVEGHTHVDPGNFQINAYGKDLIIGAGYGPVGWLSPERSWYVSPESHNLLMVDGRGPTDVSQVKSMSNAFASKNLAVSRTGSAIDDVDLTRTMYFANQRYFIVVDNMQSETEHNYDFVLHGKGDFNKEKNDTVSWKNGDVEMQTVFVEPKPLKIFDLKGKNSDQYGKEETHTYIKAEKRAKSTQMVSIMLPKKAGQNVEARDENFTASGPAAAKRITDFANNLNDLIITSADGSEVTSGRVKNSAKFSMTSEDNAGNLKSFSVEKGIAYSFAGKELFKASSEMDLTLNPETGGEIHGYLNTGEKTVSLEITSDAKPVLVMFQGRPIPFEYENGKVKISVEGEGKLDIGKDASVTSPLKSYRINEIPPSPSVLERLTTATDPRLILYSLSPEELDQLEFEIIQQTVNHVTDDVCFRLGKLLGLDGPELKSILLNGYSLVNHLIVKHNLPFRLRAEQNFGDSRLTEEVRGNVTTEKKVNIDNASVKYRQGKFEVGVNGQNAEGKSKEAGVNVRYGEKTDTDLRVTQDPDGTNKGFVSTSTNIGDVTVNSNIQGSQSADNRKGQLDYEDLTVGYKKISIQAKDSRNKDNTSEQEVKLNYKNNKLYSSISAKQNSAIDNLEVSQQNEVKVNDKLNINQTTRINVGDKTELAEERVSANYSKENFSSSANISYNGDQKEVLGNLQANNKLNKNITLNNSVTTDYSENNFKVEKASSQSNFNYKPLNSTLNVDYVNDKNTGQDMTAMNVQFGIPVSEKVSITTGQYTVLADDSFQWNGMNCGISYSTQNCSVSSAVGYQEISVLSPGGLTLDNNFSFKISRENNNFIGVDSHLLLNNGVREANLTLKVYDNKNPTPGIKLAYNNLLEGQERLELQGQVSLKLSNKELFGDKKIKKSPPGGAAKKPIKVAQVNKANEKGT